MSDVTVRQWLADPLPADVKTALDRLAASPGVRRIAVMPDVHLARAVCIGTVVATSSVVYPAAVGGDIGCGMAALAFDAGADVLADARAAGKLMAALCDHVPSNRHRAPRDLPAPLAERPLSQRSLDAVKRRDARVQLGTLGRGNHFLEFQADEADGRLWVMVHTGSRAVGPAVRDFHVRSVGDSRGRELPHLDAETAAGRAYLDDAQWALEYARANRDAILVAVDEIMHRLFAVAPVLSSRIECAHNFVRRETHAGEALWVHRKGARSAAMGEPGIIPGSMGTVSFHTEGRGCVEALCSSSHGAGRAMSRDDARRRISVKDLRRQMGGVWFDARRADRLRDEAPGAYKDVGAVMRAQRELTKVVRRLKPVLSYKGV